MDSVLDVFPLVVTNHISVQAAAEVSGYSLQYLRRLLRSGKLEGLKIGQIWLIKMESLENYLAQVENSEDHRFGPKVLDNTSAR
jgi:excisionase family DNA binding protein